MGLWNAALAAGWRTIFTPSVGTALVTGCHWLHVVCPACQQMGETDLRTIDIHPNASLGTVVRAMSCRPCSPHPPFARALVATKQSCCRYFATRRLESAVPICWNVPTIWVDDVSRKNLLASLAQFFSNVDVGSPSVLTCTV